MWTATAGRIPAVAEDLLRALSTPSTWIVRMTLSNTAGLLRRTVIGWSCGPASLLTIGRTKILTGCEWSASKLSQTRFMSTTDTPGWSDGLKMTIAAVLDGRSRMKGFGRT